MPEEIVPLEVSKIKPLSNFAVRNIAAIGWIIYLLLIIFVFTQNNYLVATLTLVTLSSIATVELGLMLKHKFNDINTQFYPVLGVFFPLINTISLYFPSIKSIEIHLLTIVLTLIFAKQVVTNDKNKVDSTIIRMMSAILALFYPGFFIGYFIRLTSFHHTHTVLVVYLLIITLNDGMAYYTGKAFGEKTKTKGILLVSPNKSLVGFAGGLLASIVVIVLAYLYIVPKFAPQMFGNRGIVYVLVMGLFCGIASIVGDLFESTLKRSAHVKDSGDIIPGRGGVLDTIDSLSFVAPIYYLFLYFA